MSLQKSHILTLLAKLEKFNKGQGIDYFTLQKRLAQMRHERDNLKKLDLSKDVKQMQQKIDENKIVIKEVRNLTYLYFLMLLLFID